MREYAAGRFANNLGSRIYAGTERYNIPVIKPEKSYEPVDWIRFDKALNLRRDNIGVHFYMDDYIFERVWNDADRYVDALSRFEAVIAPDFSLYRDWPTMVQMWNHYRKHYIAARLQDRGVTVYPNIRWSDEKSFDWCFEGEPTHSIVSVSSVGTQKEPEAKRLFLLGYREMVKRLEPTGIIFFGLVPDGCEGNIYQVRPYYEHIREVAK